MQKLLSPKKRKFLKSHVPKFKDCSNSYYLYRQLGLLCTKSEIISNKEIKSLYNFIYIMLKKDCLIYLNIFPDTPFTSKGRETRMGKGKGSLNTWVCNVPAGKVILSISPFHGITSRQVVRLIKSISKSSMSLKVVSLS